MLFYRSEVAGGTFRTNVGTPPIHSLCQKIFQDRHINPITRSGQPLRVMDELETYFFVSRRGNWQQLIDAAELTDLEPENQNYGCV